MKNLTSTSLLLSIAILLSACSSNDKPSLDANAIANLPKGAPATQVVKKSVDADRVDADRTDKGSNDVLPKTEGEKPESAESKESEGMSAFEKSFLENQKAQNDLQRYQAEQDSNTALMDSILSAQSFGSIMAMFAPMMAKITGQKDEAKKDAEETDESGKEDKPTANLRNPQAEVIVNPTEPANCRSGAVGNYNQAHDAWLDSVVRSYKALRPMTTPGYPFKDPITITN